MEDEAELRGEALVDDKLELLAEAIPEAAAQPEVLDEAVDDDKLGDELLEKAEAISAAQQMGDDEAIVDDKPGVELVETIPPEAAAQPEEKLPWSLYKKSISRMRKGITTGFDVSSEEEQKKRLARLARWAPEEAAAAAARSAKQADESARRASRLARFGGAGAEGGAAWVQFDALLRGLALSASDLYAVDQGRSDAASPASERLHVRALPVDRENFKCIRSPDIEKHFERFAPTYVEWLGDESCNVWFAEKWTAGRASIELTVAVPEAPHSIGSESPTLGTVWRLLKTPIVKAATDKWGKQGTHPSRLLCRFATAGDVLVERPQHARKPRKTKTFPPKRPRYVAVGAAAPQQPAEAAEDNNATTLSSRMNGPLRGKRAGTPLDDDDLRATRRRKADDAQPSTSG